MKQLVLFVLLAATLSVGDARKVCILFEQKIVPTTTTDVSLSVSDTVEDSAITLGVVGEIEDSTLSETSEESVETPLIKVDAVTEAETTPVGVDAVPSLSNVTESSVNVCALEAITLFDDQHELLRKLCAIKQRSTSPYVITIQNSVVKSDLPLETLCSKGPKGLLSWISWHDFIEKVKPFLNADELPPLVVRNLSIWTTDEPSSDVDPFSEVLIEMLPVEYKLVNMTPSAWNNNTFIKTVSLGNIELENPKSEAQHIEGELEYTFPIETNITFLSHYLISGLPVEMADETDDRKNFVVGSGTSYNYNSVFSVERLVPAYKTEIVSLKGTLGIHEYDIEGKLISIFGVNADGSTIEESHSISARVVSLETYDIKDTYYLEDCTTTTPAATSTTEEAISIPLVSGPVHPGFKKFFYVALVLVFGTFTIALIDIIRKLRKERRAKREGRRAYQKYAPNF